MYSQLNEIEHYASLLMLPNDIARILEIESSDLIDEIKSEHSEVSRAFYRGCLKTEVQIRESAIYRKSNDVLVMNELTEPIIDIDTAEFNMKGLQEFKARLNYQLNA